MLDLSGLVGNVCCGRLEGMRLRAHFDLDLLDEGTQEVVVKVPDHVMTLSTSFFLGFFQPSVHKLGVNGFATKYKFDTTPRLQLILHDHSVIAYYSDRGL